MPEAGVVRPSAYHDWAEYYDGGRWRIADAQQGNLDENYTDYVAMRIEASETAGTIAAGFDLFRIDGDGLTANMD